MMANEKRLIDLDEAIDALGVEDKDIYCKYFLEERPIVDAVEVVRCEKCPKWDKKTVALMPNETFACVCSKFSEMTDKPLYTAPNSYCWLGAIFARGAKMDGERRTDV